MHNGRGVGGMIKRTGTCLVFRSDGNDEAEGY